MALRGQFSIEFLMVLGVLLMILGSIAVPMFNRARGSAEKVVDLAKARDAAGKIAGVLDAVYSCGVGSKKMAEYDLPSGVVEILVSENVDGIIGAPDGWVDVCVVLDGEGDNLVSVSTSLPSRGENWPGYPLIVSSLATNAGHHRIIAEYHSPRTLGDFWIELKEV